MVLNLQSMTGNDKKKASYFESGFKGSSDLSNLKNDASKYYKNLTSYNRGTNSYGAQLSSDYNKYRNAEPFRYDLSSDMLYKQYKDQYQLLGQQAMTDTMGQAAALTGGYGNSYASTAGNQAYQSYLQQLNDKIPELYAQALNKYNSDLDKLYKNYSLSQDMYNTEESKKDKEYALLMDKYNLSAGERDSLYNKEYGQFSDDYSHFLASMDANESAYWNDKNFNEDVRQYNETMAYNKAQDAIANQLARDQFNYQKSQDKSAAQIASLQGQLAEFGMSAKEYQKAASSKATNDFINNVKINMEENSYMSGTSDEKMKELITEALEASYKSDNLTKNEVAYLKGYYGID